MQFPLAEGGKMIFDLQIMFPMFLICSPPLNNTFTFITLYNYFLFFILFCNYIPLLFTFHCSILVNWPTDVLNGNNITVLTAAVVHVRIEFMRLCKLKHLI